MLWALLVVILGGLGGSGVVWADEAPISGTVKSVDAAANTITLEATARGKTRHPPTLPCARLTPNSGRLSKTKSDASTTKSS